MSDRRHEFETVRRTLVALTFGLTFGMTATGAIADDPPVDPPVDAQLEPAPGSTETSPPPATTKPSDPPSLDELLGLESDDGAGERAADAIVDEELKRRLDEKDFGGAFRQIIEKMATAASLLDTQFDTGLGTQRVQEQVMTNLEHLLEQAKQQGAKSQSSSQSSSSSQSQKQQKQQQSPGKQGQQTEGSGRNPNPAESQEGDAPTERPEGDPESPIDESRTEWGALPARVRDMLMQGRRETFSSLYEQLTREYYRRLAEESSQ